VPDGASWTWRYRHYYAPLIRYEHSCPVSFSAVVKQILYHNFGFIDLVSVAEVPCVGMATPLLSHHYQFLVLIARPADLICI